MLPELHCREYNADKPCRVKKVSDLNSEIGAWGCAPWIVLWPILVFFAPVSEKAKIKIFFLGLGFYLSALIEALIQNVGRGGAEPPVGMAILGSVIAVPLMLAYFILSYKALFEETAKRRELRDTQAKAPWQSLYYCTVHDELLDN